MSTPAAQAEGSTVRTAGKDAMTLPRERTRAVLQTREFLRALANSGLDLPNGIRERAITLLRHYPHARDLRLAHLGVPGWFGPPEDGEPDEGAKGG